MVCTCVKRMKIAGTPRVRSVLVFWGLPEVAASGKPRPVRELFVFPVPLESPISLVWAIGLDIHKLPDSYGARQSRQSEEEKEALWGASNARVHSNPSDSRPPTRPMHAATTRAVQAHSSLASRRAPGSKPARAARSRAPPPVASPPTAASPWLARPRTIPAPTSTPPPTATRPEPPPKWMEILEESAEWDPDVKELLDGANANPAEVEDRIRKRFEKRKDKVFKEREGSTVPMLVRFGEFKSNNLWIWVESHNPIAEQEEPLVDEVFKAWFVLGKLGGFNSENMQVQSNFFEVSRMTYDMELANGESDVPACVFHAMGGPEYKGRWARAWFDLGSADEMCVDVLINAFIQLSREYFGIKTLVIGGENAAPDWPAAESEFFVDDSGEMDVMVDERAVPHPRRERQRAEA